MAQNDNIQLFEDKRIRTAWDEEKEEWYFSVVGVFLFHADAFSQRPFSAAIFPAGSGIFLKKES